MFAVSLIDCHAQSDMFFDLKTGESILKNGVDFIDHFSFIPNLKYIYHHFLYDLIIYFINLYFGYKGLFLSFLLIYVILGISVFFVNDKNINNKYISLGVSLFTMFFLKSFIANRVQTVTYLLFFIEVYFLQKLYDTGKKRYSVYLMILSILIANLHMPLWLFTLILFLPFLFEIFINFLFKIDKNLKKNISDKIIIEKPKSTKLVIFTFILLFFGGLLTPLKFYPYTFFTKTLGNNYYSYIDEMGKTVLIDDRGLLVVLLLAIIIVFLLNTKIKLKDLALLLGLGVFSLIAHRNSAFVYLFFPTILAKILFNSFSVNNIKFRRVNSILNRTNKVAVYYAICICLFIAIVYSFSLLNFSKFDYHIEDDYPVETVKYIKNNIDYKNMKLFNDFYYGSYLLYEDIPVFIDNRAEVYMANFNGGKNIVEDFINVSNHYKYKEIFKKYDFEYALVDNKWSIYTYLKEDSDFEVIFTEKKKKNYGASKKKKNNFAFVLFKRRDV